MKGITELNIRNIFLFVIIRKTEEEIISIPMNIREVENLYTIEEEAYINNICTVFDLTWQGISLGEKAISVAVDVSKGVEKPKITTNIFQDVQMQVRWDPCFKSMYLRNISGREY